jgi:hypothetical protein
MAFDNNQICAGLSTRLESGFAEVAHHSNGALYSSEEVSEQSMLKFLGFLELTAV